MQEELDNGTDISQRLSALADGELEADGIDVACAHWRDDAAARERWHAYHLIGDVLRSDALATGAGHDERFLRRLRERLADEPVVLAPGPLPVLAPAAARASARWKWLAPAAVAASFMAIASVLVVSQGTLPAAGGQPGAVLASADGSQRAPSRAPAGGTPARAAVALAGEGLVAPTQALAANADFVRDARLDRYLAAHMEFGGSSALGAPSGFLRAATSRTPDR